jgi:hypothetical protein
MQAKHRLNMIEGAFLHHVPRPALTLLVHALFGGLKKKPNLTTERHLFEEHGSAEQASCVDIVTAGVHDAGRLGGVAHLIQFLNRQSIHIGAQRDKGTAHSQIPNHTGFAHPRCDFDPKRA